VVALSYATASRRRPSGSDQGSFGGGAHASGSLLGDSRRSSVADPSRGPLGDHVSGTPGGVVGAVSAHSAVGRSHRGSRSNSGASGTNGYPTDNRLAGCVTGCHGRATLYAVMVVAAAAAPLSFLWTLRHSTPLAAGHHWAVSENRKAGLKNKVL